MLEEVPYSSLKEEFPIKYEIMILRDIYCNTWRDIAKELGLSTERVRQNYVFIKVKQARLYVRHLSIVHGHENTIFFRSLLRQVQECYRDWQSTIAFFENEYQGILDDYRGIEPGMPKDFFAKLPLFRNTWDESICKEIVAMKEGKHKSFIEIGNAFDMTRTKAKSMYSRYYHKKTLAIVDNMKRELGSGNATNIFHEYYEKYRHAKKYYEALCRDYPRFSDEYSEEI